MNKYKICVYAICKNEEGFVDRWMDAVSEADMVVVTDTGSTDGTVEKLRARGATVYVDIVKPWRFDRARNIAMDHIPEDADICVSNDMDEVFDPGWRQKLEDAWEPSYTRAKYLFTWSHGDGKTADKQFTMEKIHSRHGFRWVHPVHEILQYNGPDEDRTVWVPGMVLQHYPDLTKQRSQYLPLLELSAQENPDDDRVIFWLGREYMYYSLHEQCIQTLQKYLSMPSAVWTEERCAAMRFIAASLQRKGDVQSARVWLFRAIGECPTVREPYLAMAKLAYQERDWPLCYLAVHEGLKITARSGSYLLEQEAWGCALYDFGAIACYRLGLYDQARQYAATACELSPNDERLKTNLQLILDKCQ